LPLPYVDEALKLDVSGLPAGQHYSRDSDVTEKEMEHWLRQEGVTEEQIEHFRQLVASGMDPVRVSAHAHARRPAEGRRRPIKPSPHESQPNQPIEHRPGGHLDADFVSGQTTPLLAEDGYRHHEAEPERRPQSIPHPAGHALSPQGYGRQVIHYERGRGADLDAEAPRRRRFDLPGRPCVGLTSRRCLDGFIEEPVYG
jgi:hypothetical protein